MIKQASKEVSCCGQCFVFSFCSAQGFDFCCRQPLENHQPLKQTSLILKYLIEIFPPPPNHHSLFNLVFLFIHFFPTSFQEMGSLLDAVATAAMTVFVQRHEPKLGTSHNNTKSGVIKGPEWLVAPLISKLPSSVQGRLLKAAGEVLDTPKWWKPHSDSSS